MDRKILVRERLLLLQEEPFFVEQNTVYAVGTGVDVLRVKYRYRAGRTGEGIGIVKQKTDGLTIKIEIKKEV